MNGVWGGRWWCYDEASVTRRVRVSMPVDVGVTLRWPIEVQHEQLDCLKCSPSKPEMTIDQVPE